MPVINDTDSGAAIGGVITGGTAGSILFVNPAGVLAQLAIGSSGRVLTSDGSAPQWSLLSSLDHGGLGGLTDDDHTQYALLAGRSGGQTLIGGTNTTDNLILRTTSGVGAAGADMIFQGGNNGATEFARFLNSGNFGLGTNNPSQLFSVANLTTIASTGAMVIAPSTDVANLTLTSISGATNRPLTIGITAFAGASPVSLSGTVGAALGITSNLLAISSLLNTIDVGTLDGINVNLSATATDQGAGGNGVLEGVRSVITATGVGDGAGFGSMNSFAGVSNNNMTVAPVGIMRGGFFTVATNSGATTTSQVGFGMVSNVNSGGTATTSTNINIASAVGGTVTTQNGINFSAWTGAGSITTGTFINIPAQTGNPTITTLNGIKMGNLTRGSTNWSLAIGTSSSAAASFHWGSLRLGSGTAPTATLDVTGTALISSTLGVTGIITASGGITMADAQNIVVNATTGTKIGTATTQKLGFWNAAPIVQPTALTTQLTSITHTAPGTPDYAIQDLVDSSGGAAFGFATKDEGNTVLSVILNLQTRVQELQNKLSAAAGGSGLIA